MGVFFLEALEPLNTGGAVARAIAIPAALHQLIGVHLGIPNDDDLIFTADILQNPFGRDGRIGAHARVLEDFGIDAVMEIEHLQILEMIGITHRLKQRGAHAAVIIHRAAAVHEKEYLDGISSGLIINDLQIAGVIAGFPNGAVHIKFGSCLIRTSGKLAQAAECHLELTGIQNIILAEIAEFSLACYLKGTALLAFAADTDALINLPVIAEGGRTAGANPF